MRARRTPPSTSTTWSTAATPQGTEGKRLLWTASSQRPQRHGLEHGRTRKQTREMADPEEAGASRPNSEEAFLSEVLKGERGQEIVTDYVRDSLVEDRLKEEQARHAEVGDEIRDKAFHAREKAAREGSTQPLQTPELSTTLPIGQKPSDVEALPETYKDVQESEHREQWEEAISKEMGGHWSTGTFSKIPTLPEGRKAVSSKWVFSRKTGSNGLIVAFKARFVVCGFSQIPGVDYHHSSSKWVLSWKTDSNGLIVAFKVRLVARGFSQIPCVEYHHSSSGCPSIASIKTTLVVATENGYPAQRWDISTAYIHAKVEEVVFLRFPDGCDDMSGKVVKVERYKAEINPLH